MDNLDWFFAWVFSLFWYLPLRENLPWQGNHKPSNAASITYCFNLWKMCCTYLEISSAKESDTFHGHSKPQQRKIVDDCAQDCIRRWSFWEYGVGHIFNQRVWWHWAGNSSEHWCCVMVSYMSCDVISEGKTLKKFITMHMKPKTKAQEHFFGFGLFQVICPTCWSEFVSRRGGMQAVLDCTKPIVNLIQYVIWQERRRHQKEVQEISLTREL